MRPVRIIIAATFVVAALAVTGCTSPSADQTAAPGPSAPSSPTTRSTAGSAETTTTTLTIPANASCALSPTKGLVGISGHPLLDGFAPSETESR